MEITQEMRCYFSPSGLELEYEVPQEVVKDYRRRVIEVARGKIRRSKPNIPIFITNINANRYARHQLDISAESNLEELLVLHHKKHGEFVEGHIGTYRYGNDSGKRTYHAKIDNVHNGNLPETEELKGKVYEFELTLIQLNK